jgi:hypothetical protein
MSAVTYVLPVACSGGPAEPELTSYLRALASHVDLVVVDGSPPEVFAVHHENWSALGRHVPPAVETLNGKVGGVLTGLGLARYDTVVVADDDVRWTPAGLRAAVSRLAGADVLIPQNYYAPSPWHATYDTARTLVHRALGGDMPGTLVLRRDALGPEGYRGDVLFENLELVRTVKARGGRIAVAADLFVARRPPTVSHLVSQRVRQAYDEFARPARLIAALGVVPLVAVSARRRSGGALALALGVAAAAEYGRRRDGGRAVFPATASLLAPLWGLERGICAWLAIADRARGGVRYRGLRLRTAATSVRTLRATAAVEASRREPTAPVTGVGS